MSQMTPASAAVHLGAGHSVSAIDRGPDRPFERGKEAGPAGAAFEFTPRDKKILGTPGAPEGPLSVLLQERARPRHLGTVAAQHGVLLRRERPAPLLV